MGPEGATASVSRRWLHLLTRFGNLGQGLEMACVMTDNVCGLEFNSPIRCDFDGRYL